MRILDLTSAIAPAKTSVSSDTDQNDADNFHILDLSIADNPFRAGLVFVFSGGPALTSYPVRALGCLSDEYGMVCSLFVK